MQRKDNLKLRNQWAIEFIMKVKDDIKASRDTHPEEILEEATRTADYILNVLKGKIDVKRNRKRVG